MGRKLWRNRGSTSRDGDGKRWEMGEGKGKWIAKKKRRGGACTTDKNCSRVPDRLCNSVHDFERKNWENTPCETVNSG